MHNSSESDPDIDGGSTLFAGESTSAPIDDDDPFADKDMERLISGRPAATSTAIENVLINKDDHKELTNMPTTTESEATAVAETPRLFKKGKGLTVNRRYTTPGIDVWSTVEWELRTASIVGSDGTVVFEQNGVEIPKSWSQLATNVVVSKYFRGHVGTLEREYSVKQLISR